MDDDFIPLSALQHYLYCPRQCALIHMERLWTENVHTAEGRLLHQRSDTPGAGQRHGVRTVTAMPLQHRQLGISGVADVVEFYPAADDGENVGDANDIPGKNTDAEATPMHMRPTPVEYKRGRPKKHRADEVQLCAQALCLEDMLGTSVPQGMLFYGRTRRRTPVVFDHALRGLTIHTIEDTRAMFASGKTPGATYDARRCAACSLLDDCQPLWLGKAHSVSQWLARQIAQD